MRILIPDIASQFQRPALIVPTSGATAPRAGRAPIDNDFRFQQDDAVGVALLREADFRRWYLSRSVSFAGTAASAVALPLLAYSTSGSATLTAAVAALEALPYLLFGLPAGALADRWPRRRLMVCADLVVAVVLASVPAAHLLGALSTAHVLGAAFAVGTAFCWFDAAAWGALTSVVGRERLPAANGLIWSTATVLGVATPAACGLALTVADPATVLAADALTYVASAALVAGIRTPVDPAPSDGDRASIRAGIVAGLAFLWREPVIRAMSLAGFSLSTTAGGAFALIVVHTDQRVGDPDGWRVGAFYTAAALGAVCAALALPVVTRRLGAGRVSILAYVALAVAVAALAVVRSFAVALVVWALWDLARTTATTNGITVRQQRTPDHLQGRVNTTGRMIAWGGTPFGAMLGGLLADTVGVPWAFAALALPAAAAAAYLFHSPVRRLR